MIPILCRRIVAPVPDPSIRATSDALVSARCSWVRQCTLCDLRELPNTPDLDWPLREREEPPDPELRRESPPSAAMDDPLSRLRTDAARAGPAGALASTPRGSREMTGAAASFGV